MLISNCGLPPDRLQGRLVKRRVADISASCDNVGRLNSAPSSIENTAVISMNPPPHQTVFFQQRLQSWNHGAHEVTYCHTAIRSNAIAGDESWIELETILTYIIRLMRHSLESSPPPAPRRLKVGVQRRILTSERPTIRFFLAMPVVDFRCPARTFEIRQRERARACIRACPRRVHRLTRRPVDGVPNESGAAMSAPAEPSTSREERSDERRNETLSAMIFNLFVVVVLFWRSPAMSPVTSG